MNLKPHIEKFARRLAEVESALSDPKVFDNPMRAQELSREYSRLKDLVATGNTLREHDMVIVDEIAESTARFVVNPVRFRTKYAQITDLLERLDGTVRA